MHVSRVQPVSPLFDTTTIWRRDDTCVVWLRNGGVWFSGTTQTERDKDDSWWYEQARAFLVLES